MLVITLAAICAQMSAIGVSAQRLPSLPDSVPSFKSPIRSNTLIPHQLYLTKGLSIQTSSLFPSPFSATNGMRNGGAPDPMGMTSFRRPDLGLKDLRFGMDNFTVGASYNGLNNLTRGGSFSGGGGQGSRNTGLTIHAGLRF